MTGQNTQGALPSSDGVLAALTAGAQDRAESRVLDPLVGTWQVVTEWEPVVGRGVRRTEGRAEIRWAFGGRVLECRSFDAAGAEASTLLLSFDPTVGDYAAYSVHVYSTHFELERGRYDDDARALVLDAVEPTRDGRRIDYRRTIRIGADGGFTMDISYPGVPPGTYGPMHVSHSRIV